MAPKKKKGGSGKKKKGGKSVPKVAFDPFERICEYTTVSVHDSVTRQASAAAPPPNGKGAAAVTMEEGGGGGAGGTEFTTSILQLTPALPKSEVAVTLHLRLSVDLTEGDVIYVHLANFTGPPAQQFALQSATVIEGSGKGGEGEEVHTPSCFRAFWSGTTNKVSSAVHQVDFLRGSKDGAPPKEVVMLQCLRDIPANTPLGFCIPRTLGLTSPDKQPENSPKLRVEGPVIFNAPGHAILKQSFVSSPELKKVLVVEELALYEECITRVCDSASISVEDRQLCEQLSIEEIDQLRQAASYRRRYPLAMPWSIVNEVAVAYDAAGSFVKRVMQNAIKSVKEFDPLAVHREVARNWGVKVAAVVVLDDLLTTQWAGLYPGLPRVSLFAAGLLTMEPADVGRTFLTIATLPPRSIADDLFSAFRGRATLDDANAFLDEDSPAGLARLGGLLSHSGVVLDRWAALLTALLPALVVAEMDGEDGEGAQSARTHRGASASSMNGYGAEGEREPSMMGTSAPTGGENGGRGGTVGSLLYGPPVSLISPPKLFLGYRDVPDAVRRALVGLRPGDWFTLPFLAVARQTLPYVAVTPSSISAAVSLSKLQGIGLGGRMNAAAAVVAAPPGSGQQPGDAEMIEDGQEEEEEDSGDVMIPSSAVVVELHNVAEALELADLSFSPYNRSWLLPLATSGRVVRVEADQHDALHVVVEVEGSLSGRVNDPYLPQNDRNVAMVIVDKYIAKAEQMEWHVSALGLIASLHARLQERRRQHPPTQLRAQYLAHANTVMRTSMAVQNIEVAARVEWQLRTHEAQMLAEGVVRPATWEPVQRKHMVAIEQFFLGHSRSRLTMEEGPLVVDFGNYTVDIGGKGPRALRRVVDKVHVTHEALPAETYAILLVKEAQLAKHGGAGLEATGGGTAAGKAMGGSAKPASAAAVKKR